MASDKLLQLKSLMHDPDYYARAFRVYARVSSKYEVLATWAETVFAREVADKLAKSVTGTDKSLRIMGVGSGTGGMDCNMIAQLSRHFPRISNTVIEPSKKHIGEYQKLAQLKGFDTDQWDWRQQTWDEWNRERKTKGFHGSEKFHFISTIHSMYYVDDLESTILDMFGCLEEGGVLMIIMVSENSGFWHFWDRYPVSADEMFRPMNSGHAKEILKKNGISFQVIDQESSVDITSCTVDGNEEGDMIVDILTHVLKLRQSAPPDFVNEIMNYMRGPDCSFQRGDRLLFNNDWQSILVTK